MMNFETRIEDIEILNYKEEVIGGTIKLKWQLEILTTNWGIYSIRGIVPSQQIELNIETETEFSVFISVSIEESEIEFRSDSLRIKNDISISRCSYDFKTKKFIAFID